MKYSTKFKLKMYAALLALGFLSGEVADARCAAPSLAASLLLSVLAYFAVHLWRVGPGRGRRIAKLDARLARIGEDLESDLWVENEDALALRKLTGDDPETVRQRRCLERECRRCQRYDEKLRRREARALDELSFLRGVGPQPASPAGVPSSLPDDLF